MKIALLFITFVVGVAGWLKPDESPTWLHLAVVAVLAVALALGISLELKASREADELKSKIAEVHASETARAVFELSVSGATINSQKQWVTLPSENGSLQFELKLRNVGSASATDVQAFLWVPEEVNIPFLGRHWVFNGTPVKPGNSSGEHHVEGVSEFAFISPTAINVGNWLTTGHVRLPLLREGSAIPFRLKVYAGGGVFQEWTFGVRK